MDGHACGRHAPLVEATHMRISIGAKSMERPSSAISCDVTPMGNAEAHATASRAISDAIGSMAGRVTMPPACMLGRQEVIGMMNAISSSDWRALAFGLDGCGIEYTDSGIVTAVLLRWAYADDDPIGHASECAQAVAEIANDAMNASNGDTVRMVAYAHDTIARRCAYAQGCPDLHEAYDALCGGRAVCSGISRAFMAVMSRIGIPVIGATSESMNHQRCMVRIGDCWCHVDGTYDIPANGRRIPDGDAVNHENLLRSDAAMTLTGHHDWQRDVLCQGDLADGGGDVSAASAACQRAVSLPSGVPKAPFDWAF